MSSEQLREHIGQTCSPLQALADDVVRVMRTLRNIYCAPKRAMHEP